MGIRLACLALMNFRDHVSYGILLQDVIGLQHTTSTNHGVCVNQNLLHENLQNWYR